MALTSECPSQHHFDEYSDGISPSMEDKQACSILQQTYRGLLMLNLVSPDFPVRLTRSLLPCLFRSQLW